MGTATAATTTAVGTIADRAGRAAFAVLDGFGPDGFRRVSRARDTLDDWDGE
jgi:hypothetical protein